MILKDYSEFINEQWSQDEFKRFLERHNIEVDYTDDTTSVTYYTCVERLVISNEEDFFYRGEFPIQFSEVKDLITIAYNRLTSLVGSPKIVGEFFDCSHNELTTLEGGPKIVEGEYSCAYNSLTSLKGSPENIKGNFNASVNEFRNLKGSPKSIDGTFDVSGNYNLESLEGGPEVVMGDYVLSNCPNLKSLYGIGITHRVRTVYPPEHLEIEGDFISNYEMAVLKKENYWTELLEYVLKNSRDIDSVNWPYGFITDDIRRSATTTHKYKL